MQVAHRRHEPDRRPRHAPRRVGPRRRRSRSAPPADPVIVIGPVAPALRAGLRQTARLDGQRLVGRPLVCGSRAVEVALDRGVVAPGRRPGQRGGGAERGDVVDRCPHEVEVGVERARPRWPPPARPGRAGRRGGSRRSPRPRGSAARSASATSKARPPRSSTTAAPTSRRRRRTTPARQPLAPDIGVRAAPPAGAGPPAAACGASTSRPSEPARCSDDGRRRPVRRGGHLGDSSVRRGHEHERRRPSPRRASPRQRAWPMSSTAQPAPRSAAATSDPPARTDHTIGRDPASPIRGPTAVRPCGPARRPSCQPSGTRSGARSASGPCTKRRSNMRGCGICRSGSSTARRRSRGCRRRACAVPSVPPRTRPAADSSRWQMPSSSRGDSVGVDLDDQVQVRPLPGGPADRLGLVDGGDGHHARQASRPPPGGRPGDHRGSSPSPRKARTCLTALLRETDARGGEVDRHRWPELAHRHRDGPRRGRRPARPRRCASANRSSKAARIARRR